MAVEPVICWMCKKEIDGNYMLSGDNLATHYDCAMGKKTKKRGEKNGRSKKKEEN